VKRRRDWHELYTRSNFKLTTWRDERKWGSSKKGRLKACGRATRNVTENGSAKVVFSWSVLHHWGTQAASEEGGVLQGQALVGQMGGKKKEGAWV